MRDDPAVLALVARAADGDQTAWNELVERYAPMVWSICARYRLSPSDVEDVGQTVWLRLVEHLGNLRERGALPGWLATTTRNECLRVLKEARKRDHYGPPVDELDAEDETVMIEQDILAAERNAAVRAAFAELPRPCRQLLAMLINDPPYSYQEISTILEMRIGSIGPQRQRCLQRLRQSSCLVGYLEATTQTASSGGQAHA